MATIDLSQFHELFFEESFEGLEVMEAGLLSLDTSAPDQEIINNMFRAAHSIKGGAGTFGFKPVADFTHVVESILDDARSKTVVISDGLVQLLLESVDFIKKMLVVAKAGGQVPQQEVDVFAAKLRTPVAPAAASADVATAFASSGENTAAGAVCCWQILFKPHQEFFLSGHDPFRLIRELRGLGEVQVIASTEKLPDIAGLNPEHCYLSFDIQLSTRAPRERILSVFEWVDEDAVVSVVERDALPLAGIESTPGKDDSNTAPANETHKAQALPEVTSIRVNIDRVDHLVNLVGELVITQSMLSRLKKRLTTAEHADLVRGIEQLEENTRELQEHTMRIRMLPIDSVFQRLPRLVRDVSRSLGKEVELVISGNQTEVDKTILEKIIDPLIHLVRNSLDHGIEASELRQKSGKPTVGTIEIKAYHDGGNIVIEVGDDGAGLNRAKIRQKAAQQGIVDKGVDLTDAQIDSLIFAPGFSTADTVSEVSGRGVGMDVVKNNIEQLNGQIGVQSKAGVGTRFTIRLPLTLSIIEGQLVRIGKDVFVIPLLSILESTSIDPACYGVIAGGGETYRFQGSYIRILRLSDVYGIRADHRNAQDAIMVVVNAEERFGILVDEVLGQQQVVVKSLETNFKLIPTVSGATILGDGAVAMILDISSLYRESIRDQAITEVEGA